MTEINNTELNDTKVMKPNMMRANVLSYFFEYGLNEREFVFIDYVNFFVETTFKILQKKQLTEKEFFDYVTKKSRSTQQKLAKEIYKMLQNRNTWTSKKENFTKLESLLWQYEISRNPWQEKANQSKKQNDVRHEKDRKLKEFILKLYEERSPKHSVSEFYEKYENTIIQFIKSQHPKLYEKSKNDGYDLKERITKIIYTRNH